MICVVAGLFVADFIWFGYLPLQRRLTALNRAKAAQDRLIVKATLQRQQLPVLEEQLQQLQTLVADFEANVPTQRSLGVFLQQIANLMSEHNLSEQVVTPGKEIKADGLSCIPVGMQCTGRLVQIFEFYKRLQGLDRLVRIEQVRLTNDTDFSGQVSMQTKAFIYYRPQVGSNRELSLVSGKT